MKSIALRRFLLVTLAVGISMPVYAEEFTVPPNMKMMPAKRVVVHGGEKGAYQMDFPPRPCVSNGGISILPGERLLIEAEIQGTTLANLHQVDAVKNSDKTLEFELREELSGKKPIMFLIVKNPFDRILHYEASIQVPDVQGAVRANTQPAKPKQVSYEWWPSPILRVALKNFSLVEEKNVKGEPKMTKPPELKTAKGAAKNAPKNAKEPKDSKLNSLKQ